VDEKKYPNLLVSRIGLSKKDVDLFYKVFSKEAFWPNIFSFIDKATFNHSHWEHFVKVNRLFAEKVADEADAGLLCGYMIKIYGSCLVCSGNCGLILRSLFSITPVFRLQIYSTSFRGGVKLSAAFYNAITSGFMCRVMSRIL